MILFFNFLEEFTDEWHTCFRKWGMFAALFARSVVIFWKFTGNGGVSYWEKMAAPWIGCHHWCKPGFHGMEELSHWWLADRELNRANRTAMLSVWGCRHTNRKRDTPLLCGCRICCPGFILSSAGVHRTTVFFRDYNLQWRTVMPEGLSSILL